MSSSAIAVRTRRGVPSLAQVQVGEQRVRRRVGIAYSLLFFNALTFYPGIAFVHIPSAVGKGLAQAALPAALIVALTVNPKIIVRPNVFLCLVSLLVLGAFLTTLQPQHFGTVYRTFRLAGFVAGAVAADPLVGQARSPAGPMSPQGVDGAARLCAPRPADLTWPCARRGPA